MEKSSNCPPRDSLLGEPGLIFLVVQDLNDARSFTIILKGVAPSGFSSTTDFAALSVSINTLNPAALASIPL